MSSAHLDIVSSESHIFSAKITMLVVSGIMGELGILPGHTPLLTSIKPGNIKIIKEDGKEEWYYISGGILEVQPDNITILADTIVRAADLDEAAVVQAKNEAERTIADKKDSVDFSKALVQLARATAQIKTINRTRSK